MVELTERYYGQGDATALPRAVWLTDVISRTSARQMAALAHSTGLRVPLHGLADLGVLTEAGWQVTDYRILPVPRRGPVGRPGAAPGRRSHEVVDGVVALGGAA